MKLPITGHTYERGYRSLVKGASPPTRDIMGHPFRSMPLRQQWWCFPGMGYMQHKRLGKFQCFSLS
jgi:hypothetical protein